MANDVHTQAEPSVTSLVTGIIGDVQELIKQQVALLRTEVRDDLRKTREASTSLAAGVVVCLLAGMLLCLTVVYLLEWLFRPDLPLWACYAIVTVLVGAAGAVLAYLGVKKFQSFNPLPDQTAEALQENIQWMTNRK